MATFQYAVKFICTSNIPDTSQTTTSFPPGNYQTAVNIHNPHPVDIRFRMKLALATPPGAEQIISEFLHVPLRPDGATKVDCANVKDFRLQLIHGFEGFLVIESAFSLDVVAVYTAAFNGGVVSMDVEYVQHRLLEGDMA